MSETKDPVTPVHYLTYYHEPGNFNGNYETLGNDGYHERIRLLYPYSFTVKKTKRCPAGELVAVGTMFTRLPGQACCVAPDGVA